MIRFMLAQQNQHTTDLIHMLYVFFSFPKHMELLCTDLAGVTQGDETVGRDMLEAQLPFSRCHTSWRSLAFI